MDVALGIGADDIGTGIAIDLGADATEIATEIATDTGTQIGTVPGDLSLMGSDGVGWARMDGVVWKVAPGSRASRGRAGSSSRFALWVDC